MIGGENMAAGEGVEEEKEGLRCQIK